MDFAVENLKWLNQTTSFWGELSAPYDAKNLAEYLRFSDLSGVGDLLFNQAGGMPDNVAVSSAPHMFKWVDKDITVTGEGLFKLRYKGPQDYSGPRVLIGVNPTQTYVNGAQFTTEENLETGEVFFFFKEHPAMLFPDRKAVALYHTSRRNIRSSWFNMPPSNAPQADAIIRYARGLVEQTALTAACAAAAGEDVYTYEVVVTAVQPDSDPDRTLLYLSNGDVVSAPKTSIYAKEQAVVPPNTVLSERVGVRIADPSTPYWWRDGGFVWDPGGLSLNSLDESGRDPYAGILAAIDGPVSAWLDYCDAGDIDGEKCHVRFELDGSTEDADLFFNRMHARETATGNYLNAVLGIPKLTPPLPSDYKLPLSTEFTIAFSYTTPLTPTSETLFIQSDGVSGQFELYISAAGRLRYKYEGFIFEVEVDLPFDGSTHRIEFNRRTPGTRIWIDNVIITNQPTVGAPISDAFLQLGVGNVTDIQIYEGAYIRLPGGGSADTPVVDTSGLAGPSDRAYIAVNILDILFKYCYSFKAVILYVDPSVRNFYDCLDFFRENIPLGYVPFVSYGSGLSSATPADDKLFIFDPDTNTWYSRTLESFT